MILANKSLILSPFCLNKTRFTENGSYTSSSKNGILNQISSKKKFKILGVHALDLRICLEFQTLKVAYNSRMKSIDAVFQAGFNGKFNIGSLIIKRWFHLLEKIFMY